MATWSDLETAEPEFAARMRQRLDAFTHKTIATLRKDGAPRISGTEVMFVGKDLWIGSMPRALKARDLQRDARFALHSGSEDPPSWPGDAKISGIADEVTDSDQIKEVMPGHTDNGAHLFRLEIEEAVLVGLNEERTMMVIELWKPGKPVKRTERA